MNAFPDYISNKLITIDDKDPSWMNDEIKNKIKKRDIRLWHMRHAITHTRLCTHLKHWRLAKKSTPCLINKASRCAAYRTSKTTTFLIFHFL